MMTGDEQALASVIRKQRALHGYSQSSLAEAAGVSTKTIQRLEAGEPIASSSRRSVLAALRVDPAALKAATVAEENSAERQWAAVEDARTLLRSLAASRAVDVELDQRGWQQAERQRPWFPPRLVLVVGDPVDFLLEVVDSACELSGWPPSRLARQQRKLDRALRAMQASGWALATSPAANGEMSLYIGSPKEVARRTRRPGDRFEDQPAGEPPRSGRPVASS